VLKALCEEAGWTVEPDGTTYRKVYWSTPSPAVPLCLLVSSTVAARRPLSLSSRRGGPRNPLMASSFGLVSGRNLDD
jgi:hypothetical protein